MSGSNAEVETYSLGTVARVTGLTPDTLRAWERRYGAVEPLRTDAGTRRYREADVARLRLLKSAVEAGHRIGRVVGLSNRELIDSVAERRPGMSEPLRGALDAVKRLDSSRFEQISREQRDALGGAGFAREFAQPLLQAIGDLWAAGEVSIAGEHLASSLIRSILGATVAGQGGEGGAGTAVFSTPEGEPHELGTLASAVVARSLGWNVAYLGAEVPVADLVRTVEAIRATVVALGIAHLRVDRTREFLAELDATLPEGVEIWIGGARCTELAGGRVHPMPTFEALELRASELAAGN
mgnify:CR=1 FL=1